MGVNLFQGTWHCLFVEKVQYICSRYSSYVLLYFWESLRNWIHFDAIEVMIIILQCIQSNDQHLNFSITFCVMIGYYRSLYSKFTKSCVLCKYDIHSCPFRYIIMSILFHKHFFNFCVTPQSQSLFGDKQPPLKLFLTYHTLFNYLQCLFECVLLFMICGRVASVNIDLFNIARADLARTICCVNSFLFLLVYQLMCMWLAHWSVWFIYSFWDKTSVLRLLSVPGHG